MSDPLVSKEFNPDVVQSIPNTSNIYDGYHNTGTNRQIQGSSSTDLSMKSRLRPRIFVDKISKLSIFQKVALNVFVNNTKLLKYKLYICIYLYNNTFVCYITNALHNNRRLAVVSFCLKLSKRLKKPKSQEEYSWKALHASTQTA